MNPTASVDVGSYVDLPADPNAISIEDAEDGGAYVSMPGKPDVPERENAEDASFYQNLAAVLSRSSRERITQALMPKLEEDKQAREQRTKLYAEGIRRTGLSDDAPGGASFTGASRVVHPMLTEACIDYEARIMKELWPVAGPVRSKILGEVTAEKQKIADRKAAHMNWQLTEQIKEARGTMEVTLTQVPLGGSQFIRQWWDHRLQRPRWDFVAVDKVLLPANAASWASAQRRSFVETLSKVELRNRIEQGQYIQAELPASSMLDFQADNPAAAARRKVEGVSDTGINLDEDREVYEVMEYLEHGQDMLDELPPDSPEEEGTLYPYLISIDASTGEMLGMYRDWERDDPTREPIDHLFEFPFIPWTGGFGIGFPHIIGGLSGAATGALRALLDSAFISNVSSGAVLKGSGVNGQTQMPDPGTLLELEAGPMGADDIRKVLMKFDFMQPSPVLFQLLGFVVDAAKSIVRTSLDDQPGDMPANMPVGTQMSRVEEGLTVFTAIHGRAHAALTRLLRGLHRLNRLYLPDVVREDSPQGEIFAKRSDYEGSYDIQPTSDPTIYSDQQRFAQLNYIQGRAALAPQLYKMREVELAGLRLIKWPDPESLLVAAPEPHELNAVNENLAMALGQPVQVFPDQDHLAHLQVLLDFMSNPVLGANPLIAPVFLPAALKHAAHHIAFFYVQQAVQTVESAAEVNPSELMSKDPEAKREFDKLLAVASRMVSGGVLQQLQGIMPLLGEALQKMQAMAPPPPMDPAQAALAAAKAETDRKGKADEAKTQTDAAKLALQKQDIDQKGQIAAGHDQTALTKTVIDSQTAEHIAAMRGGSTGFTDGNSLSH